MFPKLNTLHLLFFISADFGAPSLDKFRENLPKQFIHSGISEQHMIDMSAGLALSGKKVYVYAMAPFITLRCLEQIKCHRLKVFDPVVPLDLVPYAIACDDVYSCIDGSDVLLLMTPWPEFKTLGREDLDKFMSGKVIIDPFGCLNHLSLHEFGFQYFCLGRS